MVETALQAGALEHGPPPAGDNIVEARSVSKFYDGPNAMRALDNINLNIRRGEFLSILGPSGCGKSTFLRCIAGLEKPSDGELLVEGEPAGRPTYDFGMVFQKDILLDWRTIYDNIFLSVDFKHEKREKYRKAAEYLLETFGLKGFEKHYPSQLSGGMRQRAAICRALLHDPDFILMDEPFGALDALTRDQLNVELLRIWKSTGKTIVFITHSISEAVFLSDRVVVFSKRPGRIVLDMQIDLPRPRKLSIRQTPEFNRYMGTILELFTDMGLIKDE